MASEGSYILTDSLARCSKGSLLFFVRCFVSAFNSSGSIWLSERYELDENEWKHIILDRLYYSRKKIIIIFL